jgi:HD-GYP domain-containing protein (c-di-GMP phosphodiesterase class II)
MDDLEAKRPRAVPRTTRRPNDDSDSGLEALRQATAAYTRLREELLEERAMTGQLERRAALLEEANAELQQSTADLTRRETALRQRVELLHERARAQELRAEALLSSIQRMHRALFSGTTWEHVLRASLDVTDAERGYFVAEEGTTLRVRAAVSVPATVGEAASPFIAGIARRVMESGEALRWTESAPPDGLEPGPEERFREGVAVPVTVRGGPCGVIIALDKDGTFHDDEVRSLLSVGTEAGVVVENARLRDDLQRAYVATIGLLADTLEVKDPYTKGHCEQVSQYARLAAERLHLSADETRVACYAALLHDIGKIGVSDGVLNKPGPLIAEERMLVEAHVRIGHDLLNSIPALRDVASATLYHHEWFDGTGYPEGLAGESIPIASRIVAVVDAYCAMLDRRSYKEAYPPERARAELLRCSGTQFDPRVVQVVLAAIDEVEGAGSAAGEGPLGCGILPGLPTRREPEPAT